MCARATNIRVAGPTGIGSQIRVTRSQYSTKCQMSRCASCRCHHDFRLLHHQSLHSSLFPEQETTDPCSSSHSNLHSQSQLQYRCHISGGKTRFQSQMPIPIPMPMPKPMPMPMQVPNPMPIPMQAPIQSPIQLWQQANATD